MNKEDIKTIGWWIMVVGLYIIGCFSGRMDLKETICKEQIVHNMMTPTCKEWLEK